MRKTISYFLPFAIFASILIGCSDDDSKGDDYKANYLPSIDASNLPKEKPTYDHVRRR